MLKNQETELIKNTPVSFISSGSMHKGYNQDGELILFFQSQECYVLVNRDKDGKILSLSDENGNAVLFKYDLKDNLAFIHDVRGRIITISHPEDGKTEIVYPDGQVLTLTQTELTIGEDTQKVVSKVETHGITANITYTDTGILSKITRIGANNTLIDEFSVDKTDNVISITDYDKSTTKYTVKSNEITQKTVLINGIVTEMIKTSTYIADDGNFYVDKFLQTATKTSLYKSESEVTFAVDGNGNPTDNYVKQEFDDFNKLIRKEEKSEGVTVTTDYAYDEDGLLIKETALYVKQEGEETLETYTAVTEYSYNPSKAVVKKVSYVLGEELTNGKSIEEWIYDQNGILLKSFTYNSLDSSSKFYTEHIYDGKTHLADLDQTGEHKTEIEYVDKSSLVKTQKLPNGSKFSYGYDCADRLTAITQSTEEGEENSTSRIYENGLLKKLVSGNTVIEYTYTEKRQLSAVKVNGVTEKTYTYSNDEKQITQTDIDGNQTIITKDDFGNILSVTKNGTAIETNTYENGLLKTSVKNGIFRSFAYDGKQRLTSYYSGDGKGVVYTYDNKSGLISAQSGGGRNYSCTRSNDSQKRLTRVDGEAFSVKNYTYDVLGREINRSVCLMATPIDKIETSYLKKGDHATSIPSSLRFWDKTTSGFKDKLNYVYDKLGNISKIYENGKLLVRYSYDGVNRLIREDNRDFNESYFFSYDKTGNITSKRTCPFTLEETEKISTFTSEDVFAYDGDILIAKNNLLCAYTNGRPTTYLGKAVTFKEKGLVSSFNGVSFDYDNLGRRTVKGAWAYTYNSDGDLYTATNGTTTLTYFYADTGEPLGVKKDNTSYFFRRNLQGDIIAILDSSGNVVVKYAYDAWGKHKVLDASGVEISDTTHVGHVNPIRYRGYYYDVETGLYYLQSRYYDPEVGRFISPDSVDYLDPDSINGLNLYAYCGNDPINKYDPTGHFSLPNWAKWVIGGVAFVGAVALTYLTGGALAPVFIGMAGSILLDGVVEGAISSANGGNFWEGFTDGAANGAMWGGIFALGGATLRTIKTFKNGVAIGENMKRVNNLAKAGHQITYKGMPGFKFVKMFGGDDLARTLSMRHNQAFIERMMKWGVKIVDFGIDTSRNYRSFYYLMETIVSNGYGLLQLMY